MSRGTRRLHFQTADHGRWWRTFIDAGATIASVNPAWVRFEYAVLVREAKGTGMVVDYMVPLAPGRVWVRRAIMLPVLLPLSGDPSVFVLEFHVLHIVAKLNQLGIDQVNKLASLFGT